MSVHSSTTPHDIDFDIDITVVMIAEPRVQKIVELLDDLAVDGKTTTALRFGHRIEMSGMCTKHA